MRSQVQSPKNSPVHRKPLHSYTNLVWPEMLGKVRMAFSFSPSGVTSSSPALLRLEGFPRLQATRQLSRGAALESRAQRQEAGLGTADRSMTRKFSQCWVYSYASVWQLCCGSDDIPQFWLATPVLVWDCSFTFIKRLFSSSLLSAIRVVSPAYLKLLLFLQAILNPVCASSSPEFPMMCSVYKLNK